MPSVNPYLTFSNNCEEVFDFYKSAFGGEFASKVRFKEMPGPHLTPEESEKIMHVSLPIGHDSVIMGSDVPNMMGTVNVGNNISISINADSKDQADKLFAALSAGGSVFMPMDNAPWGDYFGMFTDKFEIKWMVSYELPK